MSKWISVEDRMPDITEGLHSSRTVLVWCPERMNTYSAHWTGNFWFHSAGNAMTEDPSHWMPVPDPPEAA